MPTIGGLIQLLTAISAGNIILGDYLVFSIASVKARLEVKATDRVGGKVLAIDRQIAVEVDLTEQLAGKKALQNAAATIAERLLPRIVQPAP